MNRPRALARMLRTAAPFVALLGAAAASCSQGQGSGSVCGTVDLPECWSGPLNLHPDFYAAVSTQSADALQIRIQNGGDYEAFSDGLSILVDSIGKVRANLGQPLAVGLPVGVTPPGVPIQANPAPPILHATLYLQKTCRTQNLALYAMPAVTLAADGTCGASGSLMAACPSLPVGVVVPDGAGTATDASADAAVLAQDGAVAGPDAAVASGDGGTTAAPTTVGSSTMTFAKIFNGDPNESNADQRLTDVPSFDLYFADPREIAPGGLGPPPPCRAHLVGHFRFYFERGQPAQPFQ